MARGITLTGPVHACNLEDSTPHCSGTGSSKGLENERLYASILVADAWYVLQGVNAAYGWCRYVA